MGNPDRPLTQCTTSSLTPCTISILTPFTTSILTQCTTSILTPCLLLVYWLYVLLVYWLHVLLVYWLHVLLVCWLHVLLVVGCFSVRGGGGRSGESNHVMVHQGGNINIILYLIKYMFLGESPRVGANVLISFWS